MPRRKNTSPIKKWTLHIDKAIADAVEDALRDQFTGKVVMGARARLIEALLSETLQQIDRGECAFDPISGQLYRKKLPHADKNISRD